MARCIRAIPVLAATTLLLMSCQTYAKAPSCDFLEEMAKTIVTTGVEPGGDFTCAPVSEHGLVGYLFLPTTPGPHPVIISVGGSEGGTSTAKISGAAFAPSGAAVLGLGYFGAEGLPEKLERIPLEYFQVAIEYLEKHPDIDSNRIGFLGGSKGGELSLLFASMEPRIVAVVASLPSGVVWQSKPLQKTSSWSYKGKDVPLVPFITGPRFTASEQWPDLYRDSLEQPEAVKAGTIKVEHINGPVLLISVSRDHIWPSTTMAQIAMNRLIEHSFPHQFEHVVLNDDHFVRNNSHVVIGKIRQFFHAQLVTPKP